MNSRAQIIATIGPASGDAALIERMLGAGMDIARVNFSHGTHETNGGYITAVREAAARLKRRVPLLQDLAGPRMQTKDGHRFDANAEAVTQKDLDDLTFGIAQGVEYVVQSFVGSAADVQAMRAHIARLGARIPVIAKVERREAVERVDEILAEADAVMLGRGDLGLSMPLEDIPPAERDIVAKCKAAGKPVIIATQMLLSMKDNPLPTRAEVTDVEYAVMLGSDAVMLSEETALGRYPLEAVVEMEKMVSRVERDQAVGLNLL